MIRKVTFSEDTKPGSDVKKTTPQAQIESLLAKNEVNVTKFVKQRSEHRKRVIGMQKELNSLRKELKASKDQQLRLTNLLLHIYRHDQTMGVPSGDPKMKDFIDWATKRRKKKEKSTNKPTKESKKRKWEDLL